MTVRKDNLDSVLGNQTISFIKCDANYHELACLRGANRLIARCHPAMLIEVNPNPDDPTTSAWETFALLRGAGYEVYWFDGEKLRPRLQGERSQNYFFLMPEQARALAGVAVQEAVSGMSNLGRGTQGMPGLSVEVAIEVNRCAA